MQPALRLTYSIAFLIGLAAVLVFSTVVGLVLLLVLCSILPLLHALILIIHNSFPPVYLTAWPQDYCVQIIRIYPLL